MSTDLAPIVCRPATAADYESVLAINTNVYYGADIIPAKYRTFLDNPDMYLFVAEVGGRVVGFITISMINGGRTLHYMVGRTHPDYMGRGVSKTVGSYGCRSVAPLYPSMTSIGYTSLFSETIKKRLSNPKTKAKAVRKWYAIFHKVRPERLIELANCIRVSDNVKDEIARIYRPSVSDGLKTLSHPDTKQRLFQNKAIVCRTEWIPNDLLEANLERILREEVVFVTDGDKKICDGVSFGSQMRVLEGLRYDMFYYGNDVNRCLAHLYTHLTSVQSVLDRYNTVYVGVMFPLYLDSSAVKAVVQSALGDTHIFSPVEIGVLVGENIARKTSDSKL